MPAETGDRFCAVCGAPLDTGVPPVETEYAPNAPDPEPSGGSGYAPYTEDAKTVMPDPEYAPNAPDPEPSGGSGYAPYPEDAIHSILESEPAPYQPDSEPPVDSGSQIPDPVSPAGDTSPYDGFGYQDRDPGFAPPPVRKKGRLWWKILVPAVAVVAVAVVLFFMFFQKPYQMSVLAKAIRNMGEEASARIDGTPLKAVGMLWKSLEEGTINVSAVYRDFRSDIEGSGEVTISSIVNDNELAMIADVTVNGQSFDAEMYVNSERVAMRSLLLDDNFYGFRYDTFRDDIRSFGRLIGLDDETMNTLSDTVEAFGDTMNREYGIDSMGDFSVYTDILSSFYNSMEMTVGRGDIDSGGSSVECTQYDFVITGDELVKLLNDLYEALENDERIREQYESMLRNQVTADTLNGMSYRELLREIRGFLRDFENNFTGDITYSFFVGKGNRLLRMEFYADTMYDGEEAVIRAAYDFGASSKDRWVFNVSFTDGSNRYTAKMTWDYKERSNGVESTLIIESSDANPVVLKLLWIPDSGDFRLSIVDIWDEYEITGAFTADDKGFHLELDDLTGDPYRYLTIGITVEYGAQIGRIDYINLDEWGEALLEKIGDLLIDLY